MSSIRKRARAKKHVYVVDYRDGAGIRRLVTCPTRRDAERVRAEKVQESSQSVPVPAVDREINVAAYGERWLRLVKPTVKPATYQAYETMVRLYLEPSIGALKVRQTQQGHLRAVLTGVLSAGKAPTASLLLSTMRVLFAAAIDDGLILLNPTARLGRKLKLNRRRGPEDEVQAMSRAQLDRFLAEARRSKPELETFSF